VPGVESTVGGGGVVVEFPFGRQPYDISVAADGTVYYTDSAAKAIGVIDPSGQHTAITLPSLAERPFGLTITADGALWFTEWSNPARDQASPVQLVSRLDPVTLRYESHPVSPYGTPRLIVPGRDDRLWFTVGSRLGAISTEGEVRIFEPTWASPWQGFESNGIAVSPDGLVWIGVGGRASGLAWFNPTTEGWGVVHLDRMPQSLAVTASGRVWFTSFAHKKVGWYEQGNVTEIDFDGSPFGIIATPRSDIWVTDFSGNRLAQLDPESGVVERYVELGTLNAEPQLLACDAAGDLWVTLQRGSVASVRLSAAALPEPTHSGEQVLLAEPTILPRSVALTLKESLAPPPLDLPADPEPVRATFSPHPSFVAPDSGLILWRYIDLPKLISMLDQEALFFARLDAQVDRFEGSLPSRTLDDEAAALLPLSVRHRPELRDHFETMRLSVRNFRARSLLSCWYASDHESTAMWDLYSQTNHGIAIRTTVGRLRASIDTALSPGPVPAGENPPLEESRMAYFVGLVRYLDYERDLLLPTTGLDYLTCKRSSYEHEREVRLVILSDTPVAGGQQVACSLDRLVDAIYISPSAPRWFYDVVSSVLARYDRAWEIRQSDLARDPLL
jgi:streptogramin lyase